MTGFTLTVNVERTSLVCEWNLIGDTDFDTITGQVLTYTDLSYNSWINQQVSASGTPDKYDEIITGLDASTDYKVYVTAIGKKTVGGVTSRVVKTSNVVYKTTGAIRANPDFTLLSGKDYLQVVFWEPGQIPTATYGQPAAVAYNFLTSDIKSFIISVNNLTTQSGVEEAGTSLRSFEATDVKTYEVIDTNGYTYTYKYILIEDLRESSRYEVAVTYMTEVDILPILALSATKIQETKDSVGEGRAASYALNTRDASDSVGVSASIDVVWRAPETKVVTDTQADIPLTSSSIQRQRKNSGVWENDGSPEDLNQLQLAAMRDANGNYKYVDTTGLLLGTFYRYNIDLKNADGTVIISTQTNEVRSLTKISATLTASQIKLDTSTGDVWFESSMSTLFNLGTLGTAVLGGFGYDEFVNRGSLNNQFRLKYTIDGVVAYKPVTLNTDSGIASSITNKIARTAEQSITVALELNPSHETEYHPTALPAKYTAVSRSLLTTNEVTLYNTTLPGAVQNFVYKNTQASDADQGSGKIRLTWSSTDSASNPHAEHFYIVKVTDTTASPNTDYTIVLAAPGVTLSEYPTTYDLSDNYTGTTDLAYEVTRTTGHAYTATIRRVYIYNTVTLDTNTSVVGYFLNGPLNTGGQELIQFTNPPAPTLTDVAFNAATKVLSFVLTHGTPSFGFTAEQTLFDVTLTNLTSGLPETFSLVPGTGTNGAGTNTINMTNIGNDGNTFRLSVRAYVTTKYDSTKTLTKNFYSSEVGVTRRKLSPLGAPATVVSSKFVNNGTDMKIEWTPVTNAVAETYATAATIYYVLNVTDNQSPPATDTVYLVAPEHFPVNATMQTNMFGVNALPTNHDDYVKDTETKFSYTYTTCVPGRSYTYSITAKYYARDYSYYVESNPTSAARPLLAFSELPVPVALIDVETDGAKFNFEMAHNATNSSGISNIDLTFEYIELNATTPHAPIGSAVNLVLGENADVLRSSFSQTIEPGHIIPVGFRTYYNTYANSTDTATTKYTSGIASNFAINSVKFTFLPQIKRIHITYGANSASIGVAYETNGTPFGEVHVVTQSADSSDVVHLTGTHDEGTTDNHNADVPVRSNDVRYTFTVPTVKSSGLTFVSFAGHVAKGLVVAHMARDAGLDGGIYVRQELYSKVFVKQ